VLTFVLAFAMVVVGVFITQNVITFGDVSLIFSANGVCATVTTGIYGSNSNPVYETFDFSADDSDSEQESLNTLEKNLTFDSSGKISLEITITNNSANDLHIRLVSKNTFDENVDNVTEEISQVGGIYSPDEDVIINSLGEDASVTFTITLKIKDANKSLPSDVCYEYKIYLDMNDITAV
jgi:hypothetical protein